MKYKAILFFLSLSILSLAQEFPNNPKDEVDKAKKVNRMAIGGTLGGGAGNRNVNIYVAPSIGYFLVPNVLVAGGDISYNYIERGDNNLNLFSFGPFANVFVFDFVFARTQYEYITGNSNFNNVNQSIGENALWLGGGFAQRSNRVVFYAGLLYNVLYDKQKSIYNSGVRPHIGINYFF